MKTILCYGDSNTWGYIPGTGNRYPRQVRWTGVLQNLLGEKFHVIEEGLNGRTTVMDDPTRIAKNGLPYLRPCLDSHAPIDLVVLMLVEELVVEVLVGQVLVQVHQPNQQTMHFQKWLTLWLNIIKRQ